MSWIFKNKKSEEEEIIEYLLRHGILTIDCYTDAHRGIIKVNLNDMPYHIQYFEGGLKFKEIVLNDNYKED